MNISYEASKESFWVDTHLIILVGEMGWTGTSLD